MNVPLRDHIAPAADLPPMPERRSLTNESAPAQQQPEDNDGRIRLSDNDLPPFMRKLKRRP